MQIIEVHGYKFGIESGGFGPQAGAEQARDEAVGIAYDRLEAFMEETTEADRAEFYSNLREEAENTVAWANDEICTPAVERTTKGWRCWEQGYYGETPWLSLSAVE